MSVMKRAFDDVVLLLKPEFRMITDHLYIPVFIPICMKSRKSLHNRYSSYLSRKIDSNSSDFKA